jgi:hypothetical protein
MKNASTRFLVPLLALGLLGCGSGSDGGSGGSGGGSGGAAGAGGGGAGGAVACLGATLEAKEANDYHFSSTLTFPPIKVQPKTELTFDWSGVTHDFLGHALDPKTDLNMISVLSWGLPRAELESRLNADTLLQKDLTVVPLTLTTDGNTPGVAAGATSAKLFTFTLNGGAISPDGGAITPERVLDYFDADNYPPDITTYTVMAATGDVVGEGTRMIQSFVLDKSSTNTEVTMTSDSTQLTYDANLHSLTPTGIPAGQSAITLDWTSSISTNALGNPFEPTNITHVLVGHYTETPTELESKFLDIEIIATELYEADVLIGTTIDFSTLKTKDGQAFQGIDDTGTWLVALQCGICRNPAPWYLSILKPCSP